MPKYIKNIKNIIFPLLIIYKTILLKIYLLFNDEIKIIIGSGTDKIKNWFSTDKYLLDVTSEKDFMRFFHKKKINKIFAEHVLEHLTDSDLKLMAINFYKYTSDGINIRIAVPDGFHTNSEYIEQVKPGGTGNGADDHKQLFNYHSLIEVFYAAGFKFFPLEYWDENGKFNSTYRNDMNGIVRRSFINDSRNKDGKPNYTSLIIDFRKN